MDTKSKRFLLINIILFQLCWWMSVFFKSYSVPISLIAVWLHFYLIPAASRKKELLLVVCVFVIGITMDSIFSYLSWYQFNNEEEWIVGLIPIWLYSLWLVFSITLMHSLSWVSKSSSLALSIGGLGGALSYIAVMKMGTLSSSFAMDKLFIISYLSWGCLFYIIFKLRILMDKNF